ncbi:MAG: hypothetical protein JF563_03300, partial [Acidobacteriales bacterium]|nr:hypothetical protein [Terriglobales bacterium]
ASDSPGFHHIIIRPHLDSSMPHAAGEYESVYGKIATDWTSDPGKSISLKVTIPPNASATIYLPAIPNAQILERGTPVPTRQEKGVNIVEVGSGSYVFQMR